VQASPICYPLSFFTMTDLYDNDDGDAWKTAFGVGDNDEDDLSSCTTDEVVNEAAKETVLEISNPRMADANVNALSSSIFALLSEQTQQFTTFHSRRLAEMREEDALRAKEANAFLRMEIILCAKFGKNWIDMIPHQDMINVDHAFPE
jgi:hypothetical protein